MITLVDKQEMKPCLKFFDHRWEEFEAMFFTLNCQLTQKMKMVVEIQTLFIEMRLNRGVATSPKKTQKTNGA